MNNFKQNEIFNDGKYSILNLKNDKHDFRRVLSTVTGVCILPFDTHQDTLNNLYISKYTDYIDDIESYTTIVSDLSSDNHSIFQFDTVASIVLRELNIEIKPEDVYFLGTIKHGVPFTKSYLSYGLNLDDYIDSPDGFSVNISDEESKTKTNSLHKISLKTAKSGKYSDSLILATVTLLDSYVN